MPLVSTDAHTLCDSIGRQ